MTKASYIKYPLQFKRPAGTSRGVLHQKTSWMLFIEEDGKIGVGEIGHLEGLSCESEKDVIYALGNLCQLEEIDYDTAQEFIHTPSVRFAIEQALIDLSNGGKQFLFDNAFSMGKEGIPINGLIWMGDFDYMQEQLDQKIAERYTCIKFKIGAQNFNDELRFLEQIRKRYSVADLEIRLDANGAFDKESALQRLRQLHRYDIHSIEQPIAKGQIEAMQMLCEKSPIAIALDEELIGIHSISEKFDLIDAIRPHYVVLKPSLLGGFESCREWIEAAEECDALWWITSALESNVGLNAIAQWTASLGNNLAQGLGTGSLYVNNIDSPLEIKECKLWYNPKRTWQKII